MISVERVSKVYAGEGGDVQALKEVSFALESGEFVALMGPSGCGKSTLLHLLGGLDRATAGEIQIDGEALGKLDDDRLSMLRRKKIGFVFQFFNLLPALTVLENVLLPAQLSGIAATEARTRALALLEAVGLSHRNGHGAHQLSGGEMQRVAIARALVHRPALLLADEPTGNLDSKTSDRVLELLGKLGQEQGVSILMVTHSEETARAAHRTLRMRDGELISEAAAGLLK